MDGAGKIALGIVAAAVLLLVGYIGYREYERQRDARDLQQYMDAHPMPHYTQADVWVQDQAPAPVRAPDPQRVPLHSNERCIGGTVVRIDGSSYTQVAGAGGRPVACSGPYRL